MTNPVQRPRAKRLVREIPAAPLSIHDRDLEIFRHLGRCRVLTSDLIAALVRKDEATGSQRLRRRLEALYRHGYLDRPNLQPLHAITPTGQWAGATPLVYALGRRGAQQIAGEEEFAGLDGVRFDKNNREIQAPQIEHALLVSQLYATLTLACRARPDVAFAWRQGQDLHEVFYLDAAGTLVERPTPERRAEKFVVYPDGFVSLIVPGRPPRSREQINLVIEADRQTADLGRLAFKFKSFWKFNRLGLHQTRWWGIERFRVLTVTLSEPRRRNLRAAAKAADDHGIGSALFLFACASAITLEQPESIFAKIWQTPSDDTLVDLFG